MGYMRHHAIIVTNWNSEESPHPMKDTPTIEDAHRQAQECGLVTSPISPPATNGYRTFLVFPDGSKEGWETSDEGDAARDAFVAWLEKSRYDDGSTPFDWAEVQYGDEDGHQYVVRASGLRR
jgi:hypothetical protein